MEHLPAEDVVWAQASEENFTGTVQFGPLSSTPGGLNALGVHFDAGARTNWHTHPNGQVLYVVTGAGLVQTEDGVTAELSPGDVVYAPPGETHWHGAAPNGPMIHLSLTTDSGPEWHHPVTDEEYNRRS